MNYFRLLWNLYQQKQNTTKSRQQIELLQKQKLGKILRYAYEHSPYYRKAFEDAGIKAEAISRTPLSKFPTLDKDQLMEHFDDLVTDRSLKQEGLLRFDECLTAETETYLGKYHVVHSSGSTGIPRYFVYDNRAWEQMLIGIIRGALWDLYQQKQNTRKSRQQIELLQKQKLEKVLRYAYEHSVYYRKAF